MKQARLEGPGSNSTEPRFISYETGNNKKEGEKRSDKKKRRTVKEKEYKVELGYDERLNLQCKITKITLLIPMVVDGYCKNRKIPDNYRSKVEERVKRKFNKHIKRRCLEHNLSPEEERQFTPKLSNLDYAENNNPESDEELEEHDSDDYFS
jgi:hypothetical protein